MNVEKQHFGLTGAGAHIVSTSQAAAHQRNVLGRSPSSHTPHGAKPGETRTWGGREYTKQPDGSWKPKSKAAPKAAVKSSEHPDMDRFHRNIAQWEKLGKKSEAKGDKDLARAYAKDAKDLRSIVEMIRGNKHAHAARRAYNLDTVVRDQIPLRLYNDLMRHIGAS